MSAGLTSLPLLRELTRACRTLAATSLFLLLESLVLERLRTPRRSFPTLPPSALLERGRRERLPLRRRLLPPTLSLRPGVMPRLSEMTTLPDLVSSSVSTSTPLVSCLELTWLFTCLRSLV